MLLDKMGQSVVQFMRYDAAKASTLVKAEATTTKRQRRFHFPCTLTMSLQRNDCYRQRRLVTVRPTGMSCACCVRVKCCDDVRMAYRPTCITRLYYPFLQAYTLSLPLSLIHI